MSETSGSAGCFLASRRPGRASRVSAPPPAAREEDKARGPGEAPDYDRARPAQETGEPVASRSQALSANTSLSHGQSRFSRRSRSPAASASWMSAAGTRTPSSRPQVPSATCRVTSQTASERGLYSLSYWRVQLASGLRLLVQPDVFHTPAVIDAVGHRREALDPRLKAARRGGVEGDRPEIGFRQPALDLPDDFLALFRVSRH